MAPRWATIALCISAVVASAHAAALATQDEYVVSADSSHKSTVPSVDTTEKPLEPIKLSEMRVRSEIALRYARTSVVTHVRNPDARAQEATFRMLLPNTAFISGFTMTLSGKAYKAYVKEKEEAKQIYTQAVSQGLGAAHIATKARDSNHFTVSVNVEGNTTAVFDLRYEEFLVRRNGLYNHAINLHPGSFVPKMEVVVHIKESQKITKLRVPEVRTGNEVDATEKDPQNTKAVIQRNDNEKEATITFTPDIKEQRRLAGIYVDKIKEKSSTDKYIGYSSTEEEDKDDSAVLGQFVVQYDVERSNNGEVLVNDGYFVHFLAPSSLPPLSKHAVFVLDTSGSMMGRKIVQLRNAMEAILSDLNPNDYFSIVEFNSDVKVHELKEADEEPPERYHHYSYFNSRNTPVTLVPPSLATAENIAKAKVIVSRLSASGGTNIYSALEVALNLVAKGTQDENKTNSTTQFVDSNGAVAVANSEKTETTKGKDLEPIIIFLTDGDPTVGVTSTARILSFTSEKNSGDQRASLYSLAFGEDADRVFLRKLSLRNEGFMRHIYEAADAALQLHDFYRQVSSPLLSHVQFQYPEKQVKEGSLSRNKFRTINAGSEVVVVGQIQDDVTELTPRVSGFCGNDDGVGKKKYEISPKVLVKREKESYLPLERLWAYLTIKQLLDKRDAEDHHEAGENSFEKKALAIALKYEFVTPLTSLVVVKPEEKANAVDVESVDKASDDASNTYLPLIVGPPPSYSRPSNAYFGFSSMAASVGGGGYGIMSYPGMPGPPPAFAPANIQPLALDAAHFPDALMAVEDEMDYVPARHHSYTMALNGPYNFYSGPGSHMFSSSSGMSRNSYYAPSTTPALGVYYQPTTITSTAPTPTTATAPTTSAAPIVNYHLDEFVWASSLLNTTAGALVVTTTNGTQVTLELTRDTNPPKAEGGDEECSSGSPAVGAASPAGGVCVYLTRCAAARHIAAEDYAKSYCVVNDRYAGVCCPQAEVDKDPKKPSL